MTAANYTIEGKFTRRLEKIHSFFNHKVNWVFNNLPREKLVEALEVIRKNRICCYAPPSKMCDCKYGIEDKWGGGLSTLDRGENTGCCEMREAIGVLRHMTDREYIKIQHRTIKKAAKQFKKYKKEHGDIFANKESKRG